MEPIIGVTGGDLRQRYLAQLWIENGRNPVYGAQLCIQGGHTTEVQECSLEELLEMAQIIAAPVPFSRDGVTVTGTTMGIMDFAGSLKSGQVVFGGLIPEQAAKYLRRRDIRFVDYMKLEQVALQNAVATAEGAIAEAICLWPENLAGCPCLVLGYGRCGRILAMRLKQFGAEVSVYARRKEVRVQVKTEGLKALSQEQLGEALKKHPVLFNTIPAGVFTEALVQCLPKEHLLLELASGQGCITRELVQQYGVNKVHCPGLPGKYAPKSSAHILFDVMLEILENELTVKASNS